jgi:hypothetical protein
MLCLTPISAAQNAARVRRIFGILIDDHGRSSISDCHEMPRGRTFVVVYIQCHGIGLRNLRVPIRPRVWGNTMDELNGRMIACQILITGLIARVANKSPDPLSFLSDFRDEIKAVVSQVRIFGAADPNRVRQTAQETVDELFSLMKPPRID